MDYEKYPILSGLNIAPKDGLKRVLVLSIAVPEEVYDNLNVVLVAMQESGYEVLDVRYQRAEALSPVVNAFVLYR